MRKDRSNKFPKPQTIASHYAAGRYCDYPADVVMSAINGHDLDYNSIAIRPLIGFQQFFIANLDSFLYLANHNSEEEMSLFLLDPNEYLAERNVEVLVPFDDSTAKIFAALVEDEMLSALKSKECDEVWDITSIYKDHPWRKRHTERYPRGFMQLGKICGLSIHHFLDVEKLEQNGFSADLDIALLRLKEFFSE